MRLLQRSYFGIAILVLVAGPLFAGQADNSREPRKVIEQANAQFMAAFARGDAKGVAAMYTDDAQILPPNQPMVEGRAAIEAFWKATMAAGLQGVELKTSEVEACGDTIIETGAATVFGAGKTAVDESKYVVIWKREGGRWHLHRDIWNSNRPAAKK